MTALLTDEAVQFYDLSVECGLYCQGGRSRFDPTSWPDDYSVVKYPDHLTAIARYEARLAEDAKVRAGLVAAIESLIYEHGCGTTYVKCKSPDCVANIGRAALAAARERG